MMSIGKGQLYMSNSQISIITEELQRTQEELKKCREELDGLNRELEETNRGVVALYAELDKNTAHLRVQADILETINDAVIVSDLSFRITSWNHAAENLYGWKESDVLGKPVGEVLRSEISAEKRAEIYKSLSEGNPAETELVQYTWDNHQLFISGYSIALKNAQDEISGYVAINKDITVQKLAERELQSYAARLERSNRDLQDFAYIASHDLQEPLRKVRSFGERLKVKASDRLNPQEIDYINRMQNATERMQKMIDDLLDYSRVSTKAQPHRKVDLYQVVAEVISDLEIRIEQSQGKVEVGSLPNIDADPLQMRQVFQNLIGNALKFRKPDVAPLVKVHSKKTGKNQVEITVEDNGIGFSMEYSSQLFQPFRRLHGRSEYEGTGIGLSICRKIIERHGGTISAHSKPGVGSIFIVNLPIAQE